MTSCTQRIWLWPNLLSLDAPLVAVLWQILFVRCFRAEPDIAAAALLVASVWLIYSGDRMLDAWRGTVNRPRHEFCRRHWRSLLPIWGFVFAATACVAWLALPQVVFIRGLCLVAIVGIYFAAVHAVPVRWRRYWPKEAMVGLLFALGASLAAWSYVRSPADIMTVLLFSCLCWINCVAIEQWETGGGQWPVGTAAACIALAAILFLHQQRPVLSSAEAASALGFVLLDRKRPGLSSDAVRVLADAALLSPLVFLPVAWFVN
ncbi:MAG: hypothetical protein JO307_11420 [Bryobacterales bacterium]|nr:hypothetical protein [Bryobacterales bacterium]MBV9401485.1 hypothetical protein [Bryobacterales bacterium]